MARLALTSDGRHHPLRRRGVRIGRGPGNDITLADEQVSRRHARAWVQGDDAYIEDTGSRNGTYVNGERIVKPRQLQVGDQVRVGHTTLTLEIAPSGDLASRPSPILVLMMILGGALVVGLLASLLRAPPLTGTPPAVAPPVGITESPTPARRLAPADKLERARLATVLVVAADASGAEQNGGSGSVVDPRGYVLTNLHVVEGGEEVVIYVNTGDPNAPPRIAYEADLVERDTGLDLALLRIAALYDGSPLPAPLDLPTVPVGNSDGVQIGDAVTIMGFPEVGGETVTLTRGTVAGFHEDELGHARGWIKTDAEISPGNSGGMAIDESGQLIGIPTFVSAEGRTLGRIGGLRPVNLAAPLLRSIQ